MPKPMALAASPTLRSKKPQHPNSRANLRPPWKKGQNGNPKPGNSLTARLKNYLVDHPDKVSAFLESMVAGAIEREPVPFRELWERVEGKVAQPVVGPTGGPVQIEVRTLEQIEREEALLREAIGLLRGRQAALPPGGRVIEGKAQEVGAKVQERPEGPGAALARDWEAERLARNAKARETRAKRRKGTG